MSYEFSLDGIDTKIVEILLKEKLAKRNSSSYLQIKEVDIVKCIPYLDATCKNKLLHECVKLCDYNNTKLLLEAKANACCLIKDKPPILISAIENGDIKMVELLLAFGADPYERHKYNGKYTDAFIYFNGKTNTLSSFIFNMLLKYVEDKKKKPEVMC